MSKRKVSVPENEWEWFGDAGHFICAKDCQFHLCTKVGNYLVSTVGRRWPCRASREIHAQAYDPQWLAANRHRLGDDFDGAYMDRFGYDTVGCDREFETMVFKAGKRCASKDCGCGLPAINGSELDFLGYNSAKDATQGHLKLCRKWAAKGRSK